MDGESSSAINTISPINNFRIVSIKIKDVK